MSEDGATEETREVANEPRAVRKFFRQLAALGAPRACYEAGPCGYEARRPLAALGIACEIVAPARIPRRPGDRVKTDRRDARKLTRLYRAGALTVIRGPTRPEEAARDLVRCREDLGEDVTRLRHRLGKFLRRRGRIWRARSRWSARRAQLDHGVDRRRALDGAIGARAQQAPWAPLVARRRCRRGLDTLSALTLLVELQDFPRFRAPRELSQPPGTTATDRGRPDASAPARPGSPSPSAPKRCARNTACLAASATWSAEASPTRWRAWPGRGDSSASCGRCSSNTGPSRLARRRRLGQRANVARPERPRLHCAAPGLGPDDPRPQQRQFPTNPSHAARLLGAPREY